VAAIAAVVVSVVDAAAGYRGKVACFELLDLFFAEISANGVAVLAGPGVTSDDRARLTGAVWR